MKGIIGWRTRVLLIAIITVATGCRSTKLPDFYDFDLQRTGIDTLYLVTDCFMLDEGSDQQTLDSAYNLEVCQQLSSKLSDLLTRQTKIEVKTKLVTAGLQAGPFKHIASSIEDSENVTLPVYAVNNTAGQQELLPLNAVSASLHQQIINPEQRVAYASSVKWKQYQEVQDLRLSENDMLLFVQLTGLKVDKVSANTKAIVTALLTMGAGAYVERSAISATAVLLDNKGNPKWVDIAFYTHEVESECQIDRAKSDLLSYFPYPGLNPESSAKSPRCFEGDPRGKPREPSAT